MQESADYNVKKTSPVTSQANTTPINLIIPNDCIGLRLDLALARLLPNLSRSRLQTWVRDNRVTVNDQLANTRQKVWGNEQIQIKPQYEAADSDKYIAEEIELEIIYEDDWLIVINKPVGMVVHPGNGNWHGTMLNALLHHAPQLKHVPRAGIVHRLDKETSGLLVVAKTIDVQTNLVRQLQQHLVKRNYLALVLGEVIQDGVVDAPVGRHPTQRTKMAITTKGKPARTHYKVLEQLTGSTLLQCSLETGRTHQIRVHMRSLNHPLVGDPVYGGKPKKIAPEAAGILTNFSRQALHAKQLELKHPHKQQQIKWEVEPPEDMETLLQTLRQFE